MLVAPRLTSPVGVEERKDDEWKEMISDLHDWGKKVWVLTSDSYERTLESCYAYNILSSSASSDSTVDMTSSNFDELFYKIRN